MIFNACTWTFQSCSSIALVATMIIINMVLFFGATRNPTFFNHPIRDESIQTGTAVGPASLEEHQLQSSDDVALNISICHGNYSLETSGKYSDSLLSSAVHAQHFPVCILLTIGDDTGRADNSSLPFSLLYRLFEAAYAEVSTFLKVQPEGANNGVDVTNSNIDLPVKVMVGVDYPSVACKMVRDSFMDFTEKVHGVDLTCGTLEDVRNNLFNSSGTDEIEGSSATVGCGMAIVGKSAQYVAQLSDVEWAQLLRWENLRVIDLDVPDPSHSPPVLPRELWRPTVVTAFSSNHLTAGFLLLRSVAKAGMETAAAGLYNISIVIYTLEDLNSQMQGLLDCMVLELNEKYKIPTEVRQFNFSAYPSWMRINNSISAMTEGGRGEYAWKAIIIHTVILERGFILWSDAGCLYDTHGLITTLDYTREWGFASSTSTDAVPEWIHPGQIKYFRYQVQYFPQIGNCEAARIGLTLDKYESLIRPWYDCSLTRQCIAPDGSSRHNHRQDQSALTLLADMVGTICEGFSSNVWKHRDYERLEPSRSISTECYQDPIILEVHFDPE